MTEVTIAAEFPNGNPRAQGTVLVKLIDAGGGGALASGAVVVDGTRVRLDSAGEGSIELTPNDDIEPDGTFYRFTVLGSSPSTSRTIRITGATADPVAWTNAGIQVVSPEPPDWVPIQGPPGEDGEQGEQGEPGPAADTTLPEWVELLPAEHDGMTAGWYSGGAIGSVPLYYRRRFPFVDIVGTACYLDAAGSPADPPINGFGQATICTLPSEALPAGVFVGQALTLAPGTTSGAVAGLLIPSTDLMLTSASPTDWLASFPQQSWDAAPA